MNVGVFLCLEPYTSLENNLRLAHEYGFTHADITDTHSGGSMFANAGLSASVSLDDNPFEIRRTFERHGMKIEAIAVFGARLTEEERNAYRFPNPAERVTATDYPVPYAWFDEYGIAAGDVEETSLSPSLNGVNAWWECYVLGLNPTNASDKFTATIRMEGDAPVVEFSPTNEVLKANGAIRYVLQGKPALTNDWTDCPSFEAPGDTNRFFRVKVEW